MACPGLCVQQLALCQPGVGLAVMALRRCDVFQATVMGLLFWHKRYLKRTGS